MRRLILTAAAALAPSACAVEADPPPEPPALELTGRVVDAADILPAGYEAQLTDKLANLEQATLVQLVVATTPDLQGYDISDYAFKLGNAWGIGDATRNDGLLLLVAPNERRVRIAVGIGLEDKVTNEEAELIIEESILPHFRTGDYASGIQSGVDGLVREVTPVQLKEAA